ncbi:hypothetical protein CN918_27415 [Priestia megaterium]|nr:hypothetical protein CN918_27415 [Priestia megaterium]
MTVLQSAKKRLLMVVAQTSGLELAVTTVLAITFQYVIAMYVIFPLTRGMKGADFFYVGASISVYLTLLTWVGLQSAFIGVRTEKEMFKQWAIRILAIIPFQVFVMFALMFRTDLTAFSTIEVNMLILFIYIIPLVGTVSLGSIMNGWHNSRQKRCK